MESVTVDAVIKVLAGKRRQGTRHDPQGGAEAARRQQGGELFRCCSALAHALVNCAGSARSRDDQAPRRRGRPRAQELTMTLIQRLAEFSR